MKHIPILAAIVLGIVLLVQHGTDAGPTAPRAVPVIIQDVIPPSRMLTVFAIHALPNNFIEQVPIPLAPGQVFVLTSWSALHTSGTAGLLYLMEGPVFTNQSSRDFLFLPPTSPPGQSVHNSFPTGIRFPRRTNGTADLFIRKVSATVEIIVRGYITDDF